MQNCPPPSAACPACPRRCWKLLQGTAESQTPSRWRSRCTPTRSGCSSARRGDPCSWRGDPCSSAGRVPRRAPQRGGRPQPAAAVCASGGHYTLHLSELFQSVCNMQRRRKRSCSSFGGVCRQPACKPAEADAERAQQRAVQLRLVTALGATLPLPHPHSIAGGQLVPWYFELPAHERPTCLSHAAHRLPLLSELRGTKRAAFLLDLPILGFGRLALQPQPTHSITWRCLARL